MGNIIERMSILTCMLCPDPDIFKLYIPKAKNALENVEGATIAAEDAKDVERVLSVNYNLFKMDADRLANNRDYQKLVTYVDEHYHNLQIGKRYAWEEICSACPYRMVFLSSGTIDHGRVIDGIFEGASKLEEQAPVFNAALARGARIDVWKRTCGDENKGVYVYVF